jgi:hypothetical protein
LQIIFESTVILSKDIENFRWRWVLKVLLVFIPLSFWALYTHEPGPKDTEVDSWAILREAKEKSKSQLCEGCRQINTDTFGCPTKSSFDRVITIIAQGDKVAATTAVSTGCTILNKGSAVYVDRYEFPSGVAQIHLQGSTQTLWVMSGVVK